MIIRNITINNFQSYYDEQTIEFGKGLNLIIGNGGKGKSKLFNAFYWVLFGKIYVTSEGWCSTDTLYQSSHKALSNYEFINKKALFEAMPDKQVNCFVRLELTSDKGINYMIERNVVAIRQISTNWDSSSAWNLLPANIKVTYDSPLGTKIENGIIAENRISDLFPEGIRGYIWFQGESLDELINFRDKRTLKDAVKHISYYPFYEKLTAIISKAKEKIEKQETSKLKEANKQNAEAKSLLAKISVLQTQIGREKDNEKTIRDNIETIQLHLATDEEKVSGVASFADLSHKYDECEKEIIKINGRLTEIDNEQRRLLPSLWILRGVDKLIKKSQTIIDSHVQTEYTVPEKKYIDEPSRKKMEEILNKDHRCFVCGSPVDDDHPDAIQWILNRLKMQDEYYKELEDYRNNLEFSKQFNMFVGKIQDYPETLLRSLSKIDKQYQESEDEVETLFAKRNKEHELKITYDSKIEDVKRRHGVDPRKQAESVPTLQRNISASRTELAKQNRLLDSCTASIKDYTSQLKDAENKLKEMGNVSGTIIRVPETEWKNISTFLADICKDVQEKARKDLLQKIEERANLFYERFTEHDNGYKGRVEINEDYTITFDAGLNTSHEDRKKMSIINALLSLNQEAIGTYYPFISDAPTSSFDPSTTHKYLMGIKDIFGQSIIMTKDVEVGSDKYEDLYNQDKISHIYQLDSQIYQMRDKPEIWEVSTIVKTLK